MCPVSINSFATAQPDYKCGLTGPEEEEKKSKLSNKFDIHGANVCTDKWVSMGAH